LTPPFVLFIGFFFFSPFPRYRLNLSLVGVFYLLSSTPPHSTWESALIDGPDPILFLTSSSPVPFGSCYSFAGPPPFRVLFPPDRSCRSNAKRARLFPQAFPVNSFLFSEAFSCSMIPFPGSPHLVREFPSTQRTPDSLLFDLSCSPRNVFHSDFFAPNLPTRPLFPPPRSMKGPSFSNSQRVAS